MAEKPITETATENEIEVTDEMARAGGRICAELFGQVPDDVVAHAVFEAMIAASPTLKRFRVVEVD